MLEYIWTIISIGLISFAVGAYVAHRSKDEVELEKRKEVSK